MLRFAIRKHIDLSCCCAKIAMFASENCNVVIKIVRKFIRKKNFVRKFARLAINCHVFDQDAVVRASDF